MAEIDPRIPLAALPRQNAFEAFMQGKQMRQQSELGEIKVRSARNALAAQAGNMLARGVLSAEDPAGAYPVALRQAEAWGIDVSPFPQQWGPEAEMMTRMFAMPEGERTDFMRAMEMIPPEQRQQAALVKLGLAPGANDYALDRKVDALTETGLDRTTSLNIATGRYVTSRDPVTGTAQIIDKATGKVVGQLPQQGAGQPMRPTDALPPEAGGPVSPQGGRSGFGVPDESLYERAGEATGVVPTLQEWSTDTLGQLPGDLGETFQFPETVEDRQAFRTAAGKMFRAMSVNPKMPVAEINRIREQFKIEPGMWTSPEGLRARMRSIADSLGTTLQEQRQLAADPAMPAEARKSAAENAAAIQDFLREMGVPEGGATPTGQGANGNLPRPKRKADVEALPSGSRFIAPDGSVRVKP